MNYEEFMESLSGNNPPPELSPILKALWFDGKEDWEASHNIAQDIHDRNGSWIHAYLHRKEGDLFNARYWYNKAGKSEPSVSLKEEWRSLVRAFMLPLLLLICCMPVSAQVKTDASLEQMLRAKASPLLNHILNNSDSFRYQIIYTRINRDKKNRPDFRNYYFNVDRERYFNPASMVKLPTALAALEKINDLHIEGLNKYTPMLTDSGYAKQTAALTDTSSANGLPSIAQYVKKVFIVSDNEAYNRLYEFVGQETLNKTLWKKGYKDARIVRRFVTMNEDQNRHTNPIRFVKDGQLVYNQPAAFNQQAFDYSRKIFIGKAHYNREDSLINEPMDFTTHNNLPLEDFQQIMQSVVFPNSVKENKRFNLSGEDRKFLLKYMSMLPFESKYPNYDTVEFFDSYTKFFFFRAGKGHVPENIRAFNKAGWSYGFLTDVAYIVDLKNNVEFMLSANIYTNRDGVLNDDKYEYEETGYPFFKEVGEIIYDHELHRKRKFTPQLEEFSPVTLSGHYP